MAELGNIFNIDVHQPPPVTESLNIRSLTFQPTTFSHAKGMWQWALLGVGMVGVRINVDSDYRATESNAPIEKGLNN